MSASSPAPVLTSALLCLATALCIAGCGAQDADGPRSSGAPDVADYCNVALVPSLATELGLDLPARLRVAALGEQLLHRIRNGSGGNPMLSSASDVADRIGAQIVARCGERTRASLSPEADATFRHLFAAGDLLRVRFKTAKNTSGLPGPDRALLTYGRFAEEVSRTAPKSLGTLERDLAARHTWIPSATIAEELLDHSDERVRETAERFFDEHEGTEDVSSAASEGFEAARIRAETGRRYLERQRDAERERRDAEREKRAAEREAFRKEVHARQAEVRRRIEEARAR